MSSRASFFTVVRLPCELAVHGFVRMVIVNSKDVFLPFYVFTPVAFKPFDFAVVFKRKNVSTDTVKEVAVVADYKNTASKTVDGLFKRTRCRNIKVVCRLIQKQNISRFLEHKPHVQPVFFSAGKHADFLVLFRAVKLNQEQ